MPVVTKDTFDKVIKILLAVENKAFALDLETTGLNPHLGDKIFALIISTKINDYYFNFNDQPDHLGDYCPEETILPISRLGDILIVLDHSRAYVHNAKFDQRFILREAYDLNFTKVICTQAMSRLVNNRLNSYSLANLGALIGHKKDDSVEKYISKHKLYTLVDVGKKRPRKDKHFNLVPFDIISKYGMQDGRVCFELGEYVMGRLKDMDAEQVDMSLPSLLPLVENEIKLTKVLLDMEHIGVKIDRNYTETAYNYQVSKYKEIEVKFKKLTGLDFIDGPKRLKEAFIVMGLEHGYTEKGNASFSDENLPNNELGDLIRKWRGSYKLANTYYRNFLDISDSDDVIHASFNQAGAATGRLSSSSPNLQNLTKKEENNPYPVRGCFIPRKGYFLAMLDYQAQEYRLLLDVAGEQVTIDKILNEGLDVHTATGVMMGVERTPAKILNFSLLYGSGAQKLADTLEVTLAKAKSLKSLYFSSLKGVKKIIRALIDTSKRRGFIVNWAGRRISDDIGLSYKAPNSYIQSGSADIMKYALVEIHKYLRDKKSRLLMTIHDEAVISCAYGEEYVLEEIKKIMVKAYPYITLPMDVDIEYSAKNFYERLPYE